IAAARALPQQSVVIDAETSVERVQHHAAVALCNAHAAGEVPPRIQPRRQRIYRRRRADTYPAGGLETGTAVRRKLAQSGQSHTERQETESSHNTPLEMSSRTRRVA